MQALERGGELELALSALLDPGGALYGELMLCVADLEHQLTIARFGYAKDNSFSPDPLALRLQRPDYLRALRDEAREAGRGEEGEALAQALKRFGALLDQRARTSEEPEVEAITSTGSQS